MNQAAGILDVNKERNDAKGWVSSLRFLNSLTPF